MSDENPTPPLRLKPRLQPGADPVAPAAPTDVPAADSATPRLRLKPKLGAPDPAPAPPAPAESPPIRTPPPATPEPGRPKLRIGLTPEPAANSPPPGEVVSPPALPPPTEPPGGEATGAPSGSAAPEPPKFKFKVKTPEPPTAEAPSSPPPAGAAAAPPPQPNTPPPFPLVAPSGPPAKKFPPPPRVPHVKAPSDSGEAVLAPNPSAASRPRRSVRQMLLIATGVVLFVGAVLTYHTLTAPPPAPPPRPAKKSPPGGLPKPPTPTSATAPGSVIDRARDAIVARRTAEQNRVDALAAGEEPPDVAAAGAPPPPKPSAPPASMLAPVTRTSQLAPGVTATTSTRIDGGTASPAFRTWVANVRLNGVFQGTPARALINGRTVQAGQVVDDGLGITFDGLGDDPNTIRFRDRTGSTVTRKF